MLDILYELDPDVTFAVLASAPDASEIAGQLSSLGREFIAQIPMGIRNGQGESAQPALSTSMSRGEIAERTQAFIDTVQGAAGVNGHQNAAFASSSNHMTPVFEVLAQNGRYFFDQKPSTKLPCLQPSPKHFRCALHHRRIASIRPALSTLNCGCTSDLGTGRAGCGGRPAKARSHRISETMARGAKKA